jgi:hypothetical protein
MYIIVLEEYIPSVISVHEKQGEKGQGCAPNRDT